MMAPWYTKLISCWPKQILSFVGPKQTLCFVRPKQTLCFVQNVQQTSLN